MQLKKNPRDPQFIDPNHQYDDEFEPDDQAVELRPQPAPRPRPRAEIEADPAPNPAPRPASLVDANSTFDGKYETDQDLHVQGSVSGEIVCGGTLVIELGATAKARIQARDALVRGRVDGDIVCSGRLLLTATSVVTGTIKSGTLVVEEGASLSGTIATAASTDAPSLALAVESAGASEARATALEPAPAGASVTSTRGPSWGADRRANAGAAPEPAPPRGGRQAPSFAFVPTTEERTAAAERN